MFDKLFNSFYSCRDWWNIYSKKIYLATATIKNKKLAQELEDACKKSGGVFTYSEYLEIEQYGKNGYHADSKEHGATSVYQHWGSAIAYLCFKNDFAKIIEFGCGDGSLGIEAIKEYKKLSNNKISWTGIEINKTLHEDIRKRFKKENLSENLENIVSSVREIKQKQKVLFLFPYSLDSIPCEIFVNTLDKKSYPNAMIGVMIKNNVLTEIIIPLSAKNGVYIDKNNRRFDLSSWKLHKGQRLYIATDAFYAVYDISRRVDANSQFVFIDEYRMNPFALELGFLGTPKKLYTGSTECKNISWYYKNAGRRLFYFPIYFETFFRFLHTVGFRSVTSDIEQKAAANLSGKRWISLQKRFFTRVFFASNLVPKELKVIPIQFFPKRFF